MNQQHDRFVRFVSIVFSMIGVAAWACVAPCSASIVTPYVTVHAQSQWGSATATFPQASGVTTVSDPANSVDWTLGGPVTLLTEQGQLLGSIQRLSVQLDGDPLVSLSFAATAGSSDTTFMISSAMVGFPPLFGPCAIASATMSLVDMGQNGASLAAVAPNAGMFQAEYNGTSMFADLVGDLNLSLGGSVTAAQGTGMSIIPGSVSGIRGQFQFVLSANDMAQGQGQFEIQPNCVPEPVSVTVWLLGLVACSAVAWRTRRRSTS